MSDDHASGSAPSPGWSRLGEVAAAAGEGSGPSAFPSHLPAVVVSLHELPRAPEAVKLGEVFSASAGTFDDRISFVRSSQIVARSMLKCVNRPRRHDLKVLRTIVGLVTVAVVDLFVLLQQSAQHFAGHKPVFVDVPTDIRERVISAFHQHISAAGDGASTLPVWIPRTGVCLRHAQ